MDSDYFKGLLNDSGLKATNTRLNLLLQIQEYKSAMPYSAIQEGMKSIDRVTLYRTLETLTSQGILHKAFQENNEVYYAICGKQCSSEEHQHDHIHFKCVECNSVTCEEVDVAVKVKMAGFEVHRVSVVVDGVCKRCMDEV